MAKGSGGVGIKTGGIAPIHKAFSVYAIIIIVLLEVETYGHIGRRSDAEVRPGYSQLCSVTSSDGSGAVDEVRGV